MKRRTRALLGLSAALALGACGSDRREVPKPPTEQPGRAPVTVRNVLNVPLSMSDNPNTYSLEHRTGQIEVGGTAVAGCIAYSEEFPLNTQLEVTYGQEAGYVGIYTAGSRTASPVVQLSPSLEELQQQLPDCF